MNFSRKTILVVGAALLAACGDKVSVQEYTPPATVARVNSVSVAPATASMLVGETATFTAAVNADAGLATTVTWTSSDAAKASVSATGVVTAVAATPGVAICATSTVDTGKKGCATVAVRVATATGLTVAPSSATLNIGNTLQLTAAVSGATATPTWTSSSAAVTVSSAGLVTAVAATPGAAVCASAAGYTACSTIIVNGITITGVSIVPSSATLYPNETVQLNASIAGSNGATNTFSWAAGDANVTVSATGLVTAGATPATSSVCATSTQDATKRACAQITIVARPVLTPASVSINKITATGNTATTVNPAAVAGNIDVTLDVSAGSYTVSKVELLVGGIVAGSQTFSSAQAAALRYASEQAFAAQNSIPQIVFTVNTAAFNAAGVPTYMNGAQGVQAKIYTTAGGATQAASASAALNLTFNNVNVFSATTTIANSSTANNAAGYRFTKGDISISVIPVSYTGQVFASGTVSFGSAACDGGLTGARGLALTAPAAGSTAWTATIAAGAAQAATNLTGYEFTGIGGCAASLATGEQATVVTAQDNTGASWVAGLPSAIGSFYRIDNRAPTAPTLNFTIASRRNANNWVNDAPAFNNTAANGGAISVASVDGGVGLSTTATNVYTTTLTTYGVLTNAATLAESATNATYSATAKGADLLGNTSAASAAATFGVDRSAPTFTHVMPADQSVIAAPGGVATGVITYSDPAIVPAGPSTPSATPVRMTVSKRTTATATAYMNSTATAWGAAGGAAASYSIGLAGGFIDAVALNSAGYYIVSLFVEDGAANASASVSRSYLYDVTAPTGPFVVPIMTASAGAANLFTSAMTDNIDIASSQWKMAYNVLGTSAPGAAGAALALPSTTFGAWQSFTTTASDAANYPLYRSMTDVAAGVPVFANQGQLINVAHSVTDRANNVLAFGAGVAIPAVNLPTMAVADPFAAALFAGTAFSVSAPAAPVTVDISGNAVAPIVNSVAVTATAVGTVNTMPLPFTRVEFWAYNATTNNYHLIGTSSSPTVVDNVANRVYTWTMTYTPGTTWASYNNPTVDPGANPAVVGLSVIAIGVNGTNDAVRSAVNANISLAR
jgi:hypothetical protein